MTHKAVPGKSRAFHHTVLDHIPSVREAIAAHRAIIAELEVGNLIPTAPVIVGNVVAHENAMPEQVAVLRYGFPNGVPETDVQLS